MVPTVQSFHEDVSFGFTFEEGTTGCSGSFSEGTSLSTHWSGGLWIAKFWTAPWHWLFALWNRLQAQLLALLSMVTEILGTFLQAKLFLRSLLAQLVALPDLLFSASSFSDCTFARSYRVRLCHFTGSFVMLPLASLFARPIVLERSMESFR